MIKKNRLHDNHETMITKETSSNSYLWISILALLQRMQIHTSLTRKSPALASQLINKVN